MTNSFNVADTAALYPPRAGFGAGIAGETAFTSAAWTYSSKTLTKTNAFTDALAEDTIFLTAGTGVIAGAYRIVTRTSASAVILDRQIVGAQGNPTDVDGFLIKSAHAGARRVLIRRVIIKASSGASGVVEIRKADGSTVLQALPAAATGVLEIGISYPGGSLGGISARTDAATTTATIVYDA